MKTDYSTDNGQEQLMRESVGQPTEFTPLGHAALSGFVAGDVLTHPDGEWLSRAEVSRAIATMLNILKGCLPTMEDALEAAKLAVPGYAGYQSVVDAYTRQVTEIRNLLTRNGLL